MAVYANNTKLFSNVLYTLFGAFRFQEFITKNTCQASEYYGLYSFQLHQFQFHPLKHLPITTHL
jgi:hypothetical protein